MMLTDTANFRNPNYHLPTDTLDTLDLEFATRVTAATAAYAAAEVGVLDVPEPAHAALMAVGAAVLAAAARRRRSLR
jgi:hypothetical protein